MYLIKKYAKKIIAYRVFLNVDSAIILLMALFTIYVWGILFNILFKFCSGDTPIGEQAVPGVYYSILCVQPVSCIFNSLP